MGFNKMSKKRRNNGRGKKNKGRAKQVICMNCHRVVGKDKAVKRFQMRNIVMAHPEKISRTTLLIQRLIRTRASTCQSCTSSSATASHVPFTQELLESDLKPEVTEISDTPPNSEDLSRMRPELVDSLSQHQTPSSHKDKTTKTKTEYESAGADLIF